MKDQDQYPTSQLTTRNNQGDQTVVSIYDTDFYILENEHQDSEYDQNPDWLMPEECDQPQGTHIANCLSSQPFPKSQIKMIDTSEYDLEEEWDVDEL